MEAIIGQDYPKKVIPLIDNSKSSIKIVIFDWRWYENDPSNPVQQFNQSIVRAVKRGVKVDVIGNCDDVLATLRGVGCQARKVISKKLVHVKMIIIDEKDVILGSHNFTQSAFTMNQEVSAYLPAFPDTPRLLAFFSTLWQS